MSSSELTAMSPSKRRELLATLLCRTREGGEAAPTVPYPLSEGQQAIWYIHQYDPENASLNLGEAFRVEGGLERNHLQAAIASLVARHPQLRSRVVSLSGQLFQKNEPAWSVPLERLAQDPASEEACFVGFGAFIDRRFDLQTEPPLRFGCCRCENGDDIVVFALHHIAGEFWSLLLLFRELLLFYTAARAGTAPPLEPLSVDYSDFVRAQAEYLRSPASIEDGEYWRRQLAEVTRTVHFAPTSTDGATEQGSLRYFELDVGIARRARALGRRLEVSTYSVLLGAFALLLARRHDVEEVVIGAPMTGRSDERFSDVVGYFDNPLPLRLRCEKGTSVENFLVHVRDTVLEAVSHQAYPLQRIVEDLRERGEGVSSSLFATMFVMRQSPRRALSPLTAFGMGSSRARASVAGVTLESVPVRRRRAQFELALSLAAPDGQLVGSWEYDAAVLDERQVAELGGAYSRLLDALLDDLSRPIDRLPAVSRREQRWLISACNRTDGPLPEGRLLHEAFERQVRLRPDDVALIDARRRMSFGELDERATAVARWLLENGIAPTEHVGIVMEKGWEQVAAVLGVLKAGGAYLPVDRDLPPRRQRSLLQRAEARLVLLQVGGDPVALDPPLRGACVEALGRSDAALPRPDVQPGQLAYTIFTSGSTGEPKGVMIAHRGACNTLEDVNRRLGVGPGDRVLALSSLSFDLSVYDIFGVLGAGGTIVLPEAAGLHEPGHWVQLCETHGVTLWNSAPSLLKLAVERVESADGRGTALTSLRAVMLSGDWIPLDLPARVRAVCPEHRFISMGGATEGSVWSIWHELVDGVDPTWASIPYGTPMTNQSVHVLDESGQPRPVGGVGELYIGGAGVTMGYWAQPDLSARALVHNDLVGEVLYRTGDLGRRRADGVIEFLGRRDFQVKIRGNRVEIGEIETVLGQHDAVESCAVIATGARDESRLAAFFVARSAVESSVLREHLLTRLPRYMVPTSWTALDRLPLSSNGKVDRKALSVPAGADGGRGARGRRPGTIEEERLLALATRVLALENIGPDDDLMALGADSIQIIRLAASLQEAGYRVDSRMLFENTGLSALARVMADHRADAPCTGPIPGPGPEMPVPDGAPDVAQVTAASPSTSELAALRTRYPRMIDVWPLAPMQRTMLLHALVDGQPGLYCEHLYWKVDGALDMDRLAAAFSSVCARLPCLRVAFEYRDSREPVQIVLPCSQVPWSEHPVTSDTLSQRLDEIVREDRARGFDLGAPPLLRLTRLRVDDHESMLVLCHHHLLFDGWSVGLILKELLAAYDERDHCRGELGDYVRFLAWTRHDANECAGPYWRELLDAAELPTALRFQDRRVRAPGGFCHAEFESAWKPDFVERLDGAARTLRVTLGSMVMSAWGLVLGRHAGCDDVVFGVTGAGRPADLAGVENMVGLFINTIPFRFRCTGEQTLESVFRAGHAQYVRSRAFEQTTLQRLAEATGSRSSGFEPFSSMIVFENYPADQSFSAPESALRFHAPGFTEQINAPLALYVLPGDSWCLRAAYDGARFEEATIRALIEQVRECLEQVVDEPSRTLDEVCVASPSDRALFSACNDRRVAWDDAPSLVDLLMANARRTPDASAAVEGVRELSYRELVRASGSLAGRLSRSGVRPGDNVGLACGHSLEMLIGLYAILRCGAAYVPLEIDAPAARNLAIVESASVSTVLADGEGVELPGVRPISIDECLQDALTGEECERVPDDAVAYVIFTSGTTGDPKGVAVTHASVVNYARAAGKLYGWSGDDRVLQFCSLAFDASGEEIFGALAAGATLVLRPSDAHASLERFVRAVDAGGITAVSLPTAFWHEWAARLDAPSLLPPSRLRTVIIGGERALPHRVAQWTDAVRGSSTRLFNTYGPTETTIVALVSELTDRDADDERGCEVPIGHPVPNMQAFVFDSHAQLAPRGAPGELYLGGAGVSAGYINDPALTASRFVQMRAVPGETLYRTGDLVRYRADGQLEFVGRIDQQVKIRGFRIELGEIESAIRRRAGFDECLVVPHRSNGETTLVAYAVVDASSEVRTDDVLGYLKGALPSYMVPRALVLLDHFPTTRRGKIDRSALPPPPLIERGHRVHRAPGTPAEREIARIWMEVLHVDSVGVDEGFFDIGGHSLSALHMLGRLQDELDLQVPLRDFFSDPTVAGLAGSDESTDETGRAMRDDTELAFEWQGCLPDLPEPHPRAILLTGATGFLGTFLLHELLVSTRADIWCLVRADGAADGRARLSRALERAGLPSGDVARRVHLVAGDLSLPQFGLSDEVHEALTRQVDTVLHNGARVNFAEPYAALRTANVLGTHRVIQFCMTGRCKALHYVSTLGVFDSDDPLASFAERWLEKTPPSLPSGYSQSKWVAERLLDRARACRLPVSISRPGRITGHSETASWSEDDLVFQMIVACSALGAAPDIDMVVDMTPVDYVARAIVHSLQASGFGRVMHLCNPEPATLRQVIDEVISMGSPMSRVTLEVWVKRALQETDGDPAHPWAQIAALLPQWHESLRAPPNGVPRYQSGETRRWLGACDIACPPVCPELLRTYVRAMQARGHVRSVREAVPA